MAMAEEGGGGECEKRGGEARGERGGRSSNGIRDSQSQRMPCADAWPDLRLLPSLPIHFSSFHARPPRRESYLYRALRTGSGAEGDARTNIDGASRTATTVLRVQE